jgi:hypothetical protein
MHMGDPDESKIFSTSVGNMWECPYAPGTACNQRKEMCDKGKFEGACLIHILRSINDGVHASHDYLKKEGMLDAVLWLFGKDYIRQKYYNHSPMSLVELILKDNKEAEEAEAKRERE